MWRLAIDTACAHNRGHGVSRRLTTRAQSRARQASNIDLIAQVHYLPDLPRTSFQSLR